MRLWWWLVFCVCVGGCGSSATQDIRSKSEIVGEGEYFGIYDVGFGEEGAVLATSEGILFLTLSDFLNEDGISETPGLVRPMAQVPTLSLAQGGTEKEMYFSISEVVGSSPANAYFLQYGAIRIVDEKQDFIDMQFSADGKTWITSSYTEFSIYDVETMRKIVDRRLYPNLNIFEVGSSLVPGSFGRLLELEVDGKLRLWSPLSNSEVGIKLLNSDDVFDLYVYGGGLWSNHTWPPTRVGDFSSEEEVTVNNRFNLQGPWRFKRSEDRKTSVYWNHESGETVTWTDQEKFFQNNKVLPWGVAVIYQPDAIVFKEVVGTKWLKIFPRIDGDLEEFCYLSSDEEYGGTKMCSAFLNAGEKGLKNNISGVREFYLKMMKFK